MFFKWKVDMFPNITLASIAQCMKFKLLYDDSVKTHSLKRSNPPVITLNNTFNNNRNKMVKENKNFNHNLETSEHGNDVDVSEEDELAYNFQKLSIQPEIYIPPLSLDELLQLTTNHFEITKSYMRSQTKTYYCQDKKCKSRSYTVLITKTKTLCN
jgi:hypothetical protein